MLISGAVIAAGGVLAFFVIRPRLAEPAEEPAGAVGAHCDLHGPPLRSATRQGT
jgi:hypothetical protein